MNEESKKTWDKKIAVAILHGAGAQKKTFARGLINEIKKAFGRLVGVKNVDRCLKFKSVYWADILEKREKEIHKKMKGFELSEWRGLRSFIVSNFGDVAAYQPSRSNSTAYEDIHCRVAESLSYLADKAGGSAPLCVISHSLGTIIASNYFYEVSHPERDSTPKKVQAAIGDSPLAQGKTLVLFYTLGCPIALWGVRFPDFGKPINVPAKEVKNFTPPVEGEWINFYEKDDVFSFPLSTLNKEYKNTVRDCNVDFGLTPGCHYDYWENTQIIGSIAEGLAKTWWAIK
jgi:hypothetical protein